MAIKLTKNLNIERASMLLFKIDKEAEPKIKLTIKQQKQKDLFSNSLIIISLAVYGVYNLHCALSLNEAT